MKREPERTRTFAFVTRGTAPEVARMFEAGHAVIPFSVGTRGEWRIIASGVAPIHFYLGFDGNTLLAAAPAGGPVVLVAGVPLGTSWTRLPAACELTFGGACVAVTRAGAPATEPPPKPRRAAPRDVRISDPFARETIVEPVPSPMLADDDLNEAPTRLLRPDALEAPARPSTLAQTIVKPVASPAATTVSAPPKPSEKRAPPKPKRRTPPLRTLIAGLLVLAVVAVGARTFAKRAPPEAPRASAAVAKPSARPPATVPKPRTPARDGAVALSAAAPPPVVDGKTPERQAVDLVARGAYADAAILYERIAASTGDATFRRAAQIAHRKAAVR